MSPVATYRFDFCDDLGNGTIRPRLNSNEKEGIYLDIIDTQTGEVLFNQKIYDSNTVKKNKNTYKG